MFFKKKQMLNCIWFLFVIWIFVFLIIQLSLFGVLSLTFLFGHPLAFSTQQLQEIMLPINFSNVVADPLLSILSPYANFFHFYHLPKRQRRIQYGEITSANRDSRFPLGPDFTFHIEYFKNEVTIYEDYGPGCIFRIFIYPHLPTNSEILQRMTSADLADFLLYFEVDGKPADVYSLKDMFESNHWPFISPLSTRHPSPSSGIGVYLPVCYEQSMRIVYKHTEDFPENLFELNINCTANELLCPVHIYSAISRHKFPVGSKFSFGSGIEKMTSVSDVSPSTTNDDRESKGELIAALLEHPEKYGPSAGTDCVLTCFELCPQCQRVLFHKIHSSGVVTSLRVRVFNLPSGELSSDWTNILLTVYFDDVNTPQIDRVPIGSLFGATASLNDHRGAAFGKRSMYCDYEERLFSSSTYTTVTGYIYLPMPYWREALFVVDSAEHLHHSVKFCFQIHEVKNYYDESETGHLHVVKTYYGEDVGGWRDVVNVHNGWGQLVGLAMEVDNLSAVRGVAGKYRWAALQSDCLIFIDDSESASVLGTGLEDYFSYAHGFAGAENTTYSFVGVHHSGPLRSEPLTWHCYRQHIFDPVVFRNSLRLVMEGTDSSRFTNSARPLTYDEHRLRLGKNMTSLAHVALFYFRSNLPASSNSSLCDRIDFADEQSEAKHALQITRSVPDTAQSQQLFTVENRRYLGDTARNKTFSLAGRLLNKGDVFRFVLNVAAKNTVSTFVLRRTFQWTPRVVWNSRCRWSLNGVDQGVWFVPMGSLSDEYSLQTDDVILANKTDSSSFEIIIRPLNEAWKDVSYELCPVL